MVNRELQMVQVGSSFHPGPSVNLGDCYLFSQRRVGNQWHHPCVVFYVFFWMKSYIPSAHDCPAMLHSNQQWGLNSFVNFPGDLLCLDDLVVESVWIRFADRQSIHPFRLLLSREITPEARGADNANPISNKQICPIFNNAGTRPNSKDEHRFRSCQPLV